MLSFEQCYLRKKKIGEDVSIHSAPAFSSQPDLGKPHETSELSSVQFGLIPCVQSSTVSPWPGLL